MIYRLPPLNALRVFEAAARHLSFKDAAVELHITQAAVSALFLHVLFAGVWLGGLITLAIIRPAFDKNRLGVVLKSINFQAE